jgi:diaminopimelate decarboxylase
VDYDDPDTHPIPEFERWFKVVDASLKRRKDRRIHLEPGRALVAQCGTLVSQVLYVKHAADKDFLVLDAGMNDLIRPALYGARHRIMKFFAAPDTPMHRYDVVGPVCESSDVFAEGALLPQCQRGDLVGLRSAGAYGQVMSSRYNLRDMAPSVFSDRLAVAPMRESFPEK